MFSEESIYSFPTSSETDERLLSQNYTLKYMLLISKREEFACVYLIFSNEKNRDSKRRRKGKVELKFRTSPEEGNEAFEEPV